ncbi:flagellin N-terminal helical domain-containing protein [Sinomonas sp.]|uniref:flagellin N-terminal helical domain-containing protein n=1 Tax=Sinomonas sp. TaxID=1914986 RepID=UPI003F82027B
MALTVNTNLMAQQAYLNLNKTSMDMSNSMAKLSSGLRINTAADDAAGLSISQGLQSQVSGNQIAARNAQDGISLIQTADGALGEVHSILQRMRDLAVQGANDSNNADSRTAIQSEADELSKELFRITDGTKFNGIDLLKGSSLNFQIGANGDADSQITVKTADTGTDVGSLASTDGTTAGTGFKVDTSANAQTTITAIDTAITAVSTSRASLGASQNRLTHALNIANTSAQNLTAAKSHITDTDMAQEMVNYTKDNILSQAGTAMLAQANQSGQGILKLLG